MRSEMLHIYREACSGMVKKALDLNLDSLKDSLSNLNPDAKAAIVASLGGAGLGLATHMMTPKDKDEDTSLRLLKHVLAGAALGGLAGYGASRLNTRVGPIVNPPEPKKSIPERLDPGYGTAAILAGTGVGAHTGWKALNAFRGSFGVDELGRMVGEHGLGYGPLARGAQVFARLNPHDIQTAASAAAQQSQAAVDLARLDNAFRAAKPSILKRLAQRIPKWMPFGAGGLGEAARNAQATLDERFIGELGRYASRPTTANEAAALARSGANPRKIVEALRRGGGKKKLIGALIAAGLIGTGIGLKANGID